MRRWRDPLLIVALFLVSFSAGRALLLGAHASTFAELSASQIVRGFVHGLRFDLSMTLLLAGLPLWLMAMPARLAASERWQAPLRWLCYVLLLACLFLIAADLVYFPTVGRHVGSELALALGSDAGTLARMPFDYPLVLVGFVVVAIGLAILWRRLGRRDARAADSTADPGPPRGRSGSFVAWAAWVLMLPLAVVGIRGGLQQKPINVVNAFQYGSVAEGQLTLNAAFSAYHSTRNTRSSAAIDAMPRDEAVRVVRSSFELPHQRWTSDRFPLERMHVGDSEEDGRANRPNVVVLVLESWDALLTDAFRTREGLPPLGLTPEFDALAERGLLLTRFHAAGQRSIEGIGALLAGIPTLPGMPYMGRGMEQSRLSFLGELASRNGYRTLFVRSARRGSYRLDAIARLAGFERYAGAEDVLRKPSHTSVESGYWGAWDFDSLRFLHELIVADGDASARDPGAEGRPFLAFFFGSSTHQPYPLPGEQWEVLPGDSPEARFRNTVHYVDWSLGRFLEMAREAGYYDDTLFVVVADQTSAFAPTEPLPDRHRIPALLVGPGIPAGGVDAGVASHLDVVPTVIDFLGWTDPYAALGESVLGERRPGALLKHGDLMLRLGSDGWIAHDLARRLAGEGSEAVRDSLEHVLLAETQLVMELLRTNRVYSGG